MSAPLIFSGTHPCLVDDKGRLTIPKSMRVQVPNSQEKYWVTILMPECCVAVYPDEQWAEVYRKYEEERASSSTAESRERFRAIMEKTYPVKADTQGRFRIHPALAKIAGLEGRIVAIGSGDHVEYWSLERRIKYARAMGTADDASYADYAAALRDEGDGDEGGDR